MHVMFGLVGGMHPPIPPLNPPLRGGAIVHHWPVNQNAEYEKYHVFSTSETGSCTGME